MKNINNPQFLKDYFELKGHRVAYKKFVIGLNTKLSTPITVDDQIQRLDFRPDLQYGELQELYRVFAELLAVEGILRRGYSKNSVYRWVCNPEHSNLNKKPQSMERAVREQIALHFNIH